MPSVKEHAVEICKKYESGETLKKLSREFGCSQPTISKVVKDNGLKVRSKGRRKKKVAPVTYEDVAQEFTELPAPKSFDEIKDKLVPLEVADKSGKILIIGVA